MPGTVVYYSKTGNTKKIAEAVARGAGAKCLSVESARVVKGELFFVGTPLLARSLQAHPRVPAGERLERGESGPLLHLPKRGRQESPEGHEGGGGE
jgi:hypothetical protein